MTDINHLPKSELSGLSLEVREEVEELADVLATAEFSYELRVLSLHNCELCRLENAGKVKERKEYF